MGRKANDGRGRLGGRTKGTQNRPQAPLCEWITEQINANRKAIEETLKNPQTPEASNLISALLVFSALNNSSANVGGKEQGV